jgi:hypothetical protein
MQDRGASLGLLKADGEAYRPPVLRVDFKREKGTSRCLAVMDRRFYLLEGGSINLHMPRIQLAKHCLATKDGGALSEVTFRFPGKDEIATYKVDPAKGTAGVAEVGPWLLDHDEVRKKEDDPCTATVVGGISGDAALKKAPCFTRIADRYELLTAYEKVNERGVAIAIPAGAVTGTDLGRAVFPSGEAGAFDWKPWFFDPKKGLRSMPRYIWRFDIAASRGTTQAEITDEFLALFDAVLERVRVVRLLARSGDPIEMIFDRPKEGGWKRLLIPYGVAEPNAAPTLVAVGLTKGAVAELEAKLSKAPFRHGDSGTMLLGEFREQATPLLTEQSTRPLGVLSTVGGENVCEGDDLNCCERGY